MDLDLNNICRLCLKLTKACVDLFPKNGVKDLSKEETDKIIEKIGFCYNLQIQPNDELPTKICHKCIQIVTLFYITKQNISQSDQFLKNSLILKRLSEQNDHQDLESRDKVVQENESNNDYTSGSSIQIVGETSSLRFQELDENKLKNALHLKLSGSHSLSKERNLSVNDELSPKQKNTIVNKPETSLTQIDNTILSKSNLSNDKVVEISSKSKTSKISRKAIKKRNKKFLRKKKNNFLITKINDDKEDPSRRDLHPQEQSNCNLNEPYGNETETPSYLKGEKNECNVSINCKNDEFSHDLNSNNLNSTSSSCENSFTLVANSKMKSESQNGKVISPNSKEDKLKDYYEKLLNADKNLKIKYCRLTSQKSTLRNEMALEKKKANEVNMKIYNLVKVTVNIANAVSEINNINDKEKMERVFDTLIRGGGQFENFVKGQQKSGVSTVNNTGDDKSNHVLKEDKQQNTTEKATDGFEIFHEKKTSDCNDSQSKITEDKNSNDNALGEIKAELEVSNEKPKAQKTMKKRPPEEVKVIGTVIDLDNILHPDVKRKRISLKDQDQSPSNISRQKSDKKTPTTSPILNIKTEILSDEEMPKTKKVKKSNIGEKTNLKKNFSKPPKNKLM